MSRFPQILGMPVKPGMELVAIVGSNLVDAEGEDLNHVISKRLAKKYKGVRL